MKKVSNIPDEPNYLGMQFYGQRKQLTEEMVCFQQAATAYIQYSKETWPSISGESLRKQNGKHGASESAEQTKLEARLNKYIDRMYNIVQSQFKRYQKINENAVFQELDKVVQCQNKMEANQSKNPSMPKVGNIIETASDE